MQVITIDLSELDIGDKRLGKGGFGDVYEGNWKKEGGMTVAVKVTRSCSSVGLCVCLRMYISAFSIHPSYAFRHLSECGKIM